MYALLIVCELLLINEKGRFRAEREAGLFFYVEGNSYEMLTRKKKSCSAFLNL